MGCPECGQQIKIPAPPKNKTIVGELSYPDPAPPTPRRSEVHLEPEPRRSEVHLEPELVDTSSSGGTGRQVLLLAAAIVLTSVVSILTMVLLNLSEKKKLREEQAELSEEQDRVSQMRSKVTAERLKVERMRDEATTILDKAAREREATAEDLRKIEVVPKQNAAILSQIKRERTECELEQKQLEKKRREIEEDRSKTAASLRRLDEERSALLKLKRSVDEENGKAKLDRERAEQDAKQALLVLTEAREKDLQTKANLQKIEKALVQFTNKLRSKSPEERKQVARALEELGPCAAKADYDLCISVITETEPEMKRAVLEALNSVQPRLHHLVMRLLIPPVENSADHYIETINKLPLFGRAGLPLIEAQFEAKLPNVERLSLFQLKRLLTAHAQALGSIARQHDEAVPLLIKLPVSRCASRFEPRHQFGLERIVGRHLLAAVATKPALKKQTLPFFRSLLSSEAEEDRLFGVEALATTTFRKEAIIYLEGLKSDPSPRVKAAVRKALQQESTDKE
jgi:hypothetical protein